MKNLLISGFIAILFTMTITSCGDESNDPTPVAPTVAEYVGYWEFVSGTIVEQNDNVLTFTSLNTNCSATSDYPLFNLELDVKSDNVATQKSPCFPDANLTYTAVVTNGVLKSISFKDTGFPAYNFVDVVVDKDKKTITAKQTLALKEAKSMTYVFKLK